MTELTLTESKNKEISAALKEAGYSANPRKLYDSFSKGRGDKTYLTYSRNVIRATKNTQGERIVTRFFGKPNGKASDSQDHRYSSWFFNGYRGKAGSLV
jgi:hypothetical protein